MQRAAALLVLVALPFGHGTDTVTMEWFGMTWSGGNQELARSLGGLFADADVAAAVNLTYYPMTGGCPIMVDDGFLGAKTMSFSTGEGCPKMHDNEACAIHALECVDGCSGSAASQLAAFMACNEEGWEHLLCKGGDSRSSACIKQAGIDEVAYQQCKQDPAMISQLELGFTRAGYAVHTNSWPKVLIAGNDHSNAQDEASLKVALCTEGVKAACASVVNDWWWFFGGASSFSDALWHAVTSLKDV